ncbi:MAG: hypothetical protein V3T17_03360 [Pseudomonadales bacterium]
MIKLYKNQSLRTIFLALLATITFVGSAIFIFAVEPNVMLQFFLVSLFGLGLLIVAALVFTGLRILFKRWQQR